MYETVIQCSANYGSSDCVEYNLTEYDVLCQNSVHYSMMST